MSKQPRVIKADQIHGVQPVEFNATDTLEDLRKRIEQGNDEIAKYRQSAVAEAQKLFEQKCQEGFNAGYRDGLAKGEQDARVNHHAELEKEVTKRMGTAMPTLQAVIRALVEARDHWQGEWERIGLELICDIAARVVKQVVTKPNDVAIRNLAAALALVGRIPEVTIHVHPSELETLELNREAWNASTRGIGEVNLVADPAVGVGGCRIETEFGSIDATIEKQLERIRAELLGDEMPSD
ncbi:MAG: FliH/SctL family protein [Planctomycetota bacterium]